MRQFVKSPQETETCRVDNFGLQESDKAIRMPVYRKDDEAFIKYLWVPKSVIDSQERYTGYTQFKVKKWFLKKELQPNWILGE